VPGKAFKRRHFGIIQVCKSNRGNKARQIFTGNLACFPLFLNASNKIILIKKKLR